PSVLHPGSLTGAEVGVHRFALPGDRRALQRVLPVDVVFLAHEPLPEGVGELVAGHGHQQLHQRFGWSMASFRASWAKNDAQTSCTKLTESKIWGAGADPACGGRRAECAVHSGGTIRVPRPAASAARILGTGPLSPGVFPPYPAP